MKTMGRKMLLLDERGHGVSLFRGSAPCTAERGDTIAFGLKYLNRPAYAEKENLTDHFASTFEITEREREIASLLLTGAGTKEIGAKLFISAKIADNHVTNIYRKLGVASRVQMFQLIRTNAIE